MESDSNLPAVTVKINDNLEVDFHRMTVKKPFHRHLHRTYEPGLWLQLHTYHQRRHLHFKVNKLQVDNQLPDVLFPVVFSRVHPGKRWNCPSYLPSCQSCMETPPPPITSCTMRRSTCRTRIWWGKVWVRVSLSVLLYSSCSSTSCTCLLLRCTSASLSQVMPLIIIRGDGIYYCVKYENGNIS